MFRGVVSSTQLVNDVSNDFFVNIRGDSYSNDVSFVSTLRALVYPRIGEEDGLCLRYHTLGRIDDKGSLVLCLNRRLAGLGENGIIDIVDCGNYSNTMDFVKNHFSEMYQNYHNLEKFSIFYHKSFDAVCYIDPTHKNVAIFVDNLDMQKNHYLQCSIVAFLPWYFDPAKGVSPLEKRLIESLGMRDSIQYEDTIAEIAKQYDFRTTKIRKLLSDFENVAERKRCEEIKHDIENCRHDIDTYNNSIGAIIRKMHDSEITLLGLEAKIAKSEGESEIMDYFLGNSSLILERVDDRFMTFVVKGYLEYFDEDGAEEFISNRESCVYKPNGRACNKIIEVDDMEKLMRAIFIDQTLRIKTCAAYKFDLNGCVTSISHYAYGSECRDCTPNPHIDAYACMGNYTRSINELLKDRNYIGAIEQCSASCRSLNFFDSTVLSEFFRRLYELSDENINIRCIELPNKDVVTPKEAVKWLKEQEVAHE